MSISKISVLFAISILYLVPYLWVICSLVVGTVLLSLNSYWPGLNKYSNFEENLHIGEKLIWAENGRCTRLLSLKTISICLFFSLLISDMI